MKSQLSFSNLSTVDGAENEATMKRSYGLEIGEAPLQWVPAEMGVDFAEFRRKLADGHNHVCLSVSSRRFLWPPVLRVPAGFGKTYLNNNLMCLARESQQSCGLRDQPELLS